MGPVGLVGAWMDGWMIWGGESTVSSLISQAH
jgi:hypothetical protein